MKRLYLILPIFLFSCSKSNSDNRLDVTGHNAIFIVGEWKIISQISDIPYDWDNNGFQETDIYSTLTDCQKSAGYNFYNNYTTSGSGDIRIGYTAASVCTPSIVPFHYSFQDKGYELVTEFYSKTLIENIISLDSHNLITTRINQFPTGEHLTITTTYQKQ